MTSTDKTFLAALTKKADACSINCLCAHHIFLSPKSKKKLKTLQQSDATVIPRCVLTKTGLTANRPIAQFYIWDNSQCDSGWVAAPSNEAIF